MNGKNNFYQEVYPSETNHNVVCLRGEKVVLRPFDVALDFDLFMKWINEPDIVRCLLRIPPVYREQQLAWFKSLPHASEIVFTIETFNREIIGMSGLERIDMVNGIAATWQIIGDNQFRGRGLGTDAKKLLLDYAFNTLRLEKIYAEIIAFNERSLHYNKKCGFREEGRLRNQIFREGKRHDLILLGILREEFAERSLRKGYLD